MTCRNCLRKDNNCPGVPKCKCWICRCDQGGKIPFRSLEGKEITKLRKEDVMNISSVHGAVEKFSMNHNGVEYIVKPNTDHVFRKHAEIENLCNRISRIMGIDVPKSGIAKINGNISFVQENFISKSKKRVSLIHIYRYLKKGDDFSVETLVRVIQKEATDKTSMKRFVDTILNDCIIGNTDRHGRNLAFVVANGSVTLSPTYDNMSLILPGRFGLKNEFVGKIATSKSKKPTAKDYKDELIRLGFSAEVKKFISKFNSRKKEIFEEVDRSGLEIDQKIDFKTHINRTLGDLCA